MPRPEKVTQVEALEQVIASSSNFFLVEYQLRGQGQGKGLAASEMTVLRRKVRQAGARLLVAKNTLLGVALGEGLAAQLEQYLVGPTAIVFAGADPVAPAKALFDFAKSNPGSLPRIKGGVVDGVVMDASGVERLSTLPGKDQLRAQLLGALLAPASQLLRLLSAPLTQLVQVLEARRASKKEE